MRKYSKGEIAKELLLLAVVGGAVATVFVLPGLAVIFKTFDAKSSKDRYRVVRTLTRLEQNGLVTRQIKDGAERLVVTDKGKEKIWSTLHEDMIILRPRKWDRQWHIVMFDIPETKSKARKEVSFKIKDIGMKAIQNSVFISPFPCKEQIDEIATHYNVQRHFIYVTTSHIECADDLLKYFKLK